jgi:hypothetical protein
LKELVLQHRGVIGKVYVFSDDLNACRQFPFLQDAVFFDEPNPHDTLWIMSRFSNFAISNSTFSWWAVQIAKHTQKH